MILKCTFAVLAACGLMLTNDDEKKSDSEVNLKGVKCIMMGKMNAKEANAVDFMDGKVYLCCKRCVAGFEKNKDKHANKARHQMALTGQYVQKGCPFSGGKVDKEQTTKVGGVEVAFCCGGCKGKVEGADDLAAKTKMVFNEKAFKNGFAKKSAEKK